LNIFYVYQLYLLLKFVDTMQTNSTYYWNS